MGQLDPGMMSTYLAASLLQQHGGGRLGPGDNPHCKIQTMVFQALSRVLEECDGANIDGPGGPEVPGDRKHVKHIRKQKGREVLTLLCIGESISSGST